ncbi:Dolichyl-phosphate-mannose--protein mannosyltransferase 1 [Golovinomyces cichoracearum]|uniref:Dolichyl-phosphate-mannose--protein mannosyltransferase n=1 Tax=Golovinomyces cichoracearum TaxID=62708 RepID=A0A420IX03_9PEZI|nr:Dolichyl-phosphate-mannose--protein mannosyltransferase 1 [Golovinomyces cichoracearum]
MTCQPKSKEAKLASNEEATETRPSSTYFRDSRSEGVEDHDVFLLPSSDYKIMLGITLLAIVVRLFRIYQPSSVVFDEVHFGGFASKYIKGRFFVDVHPPLAKLLITLVGWLAGFDGEFTFKHIGMDYLEPGVPYVAMRMLPAICGILSIPTTFLTLKATGCQTLTATLGALLITFENGLITQARLILLDSPLLFLISLTGLAFTSFTNQQEQGPSKAFQPVWWFWLVMTGVCLGATLSVKWVGLFTIAWVGSLTIVQLWVLLGDFKNVSPRLFAKHFLSRFLCLILIPISIYMLMFGINFICLVNPGDGDGFMSSEFQATLNTKAMQDVAADVAIGSRVSIRHHNTQGGYLHSHNIMYPTGSKQQQITLYPHKDENNIWLLENITQPLDKNAEPINGSYAWDAITPPSFIKNGDVIKLLHMATGRRLHSHEIRPPVTEAEWQNEVSAYGYEGFAGDANDYFRVEIVKKISSGEEAKNRIRTIQTKFKLVHVMTGCVLFSHKVKLPPWASEQQEVTCAKGGSLPNSIWYVEYSDHPQLGESAEKVNYIKLGFLKKFWEYQKVMWTTNAGLVESHTWDSRPQAWPLLQRGINFWGKDHRQIYLFGNPIIWWSSTTAIAIYFSFKAIAILRWQRGYNDYKNTVFKRFDYEVGTMVLAWAFNYFPYFLMKRQLFLHHYFPALYFAILALCLIFDFVTNRIRVLYSAKNLILSRLGAFVFLFFSITAFWIYSPIVYGNVWTQSDCAKAKLFNSWDWDCSTFFNEYSDYSVQALNNFKVHKTDTPIINSESSNSGQKAQNIEDQKPILDGEAKILSYGPEFKLKNILSAGQNILSSEQKVEYRDQDGQILNEEQVKYLRGKVNFKTRYETKTRLVNSQGIEVNSPDT